MPPAKTARDEYIDSYVMQATLPDCRIYPSMFSHNASDANNFATEALYNRDRGLFMKYIPLIQSLSAAWRPQPKACSPQRSQRPQRSLCVRTI